MGLENQNTKAVTETKGAQGASRASSTEDTPSARHFAPMSLAALIIEALQDSEQYALEMQKLFAQVDQEFACAYSGGSQNADGSYTFNEDRGLIAGMMNAEMSIGEQEAQGLHAQMLGLIGAAGAGGFSLMSSVGAIRNEYKETAPHQASLSETKDFETQLFKPETEKTGIGDVAGQNIELRGTAQVSGNTSQQVVSLTPENVSALGGRGADPIPTKQAEKETTYHTPQSGVDTRSEADGSTASSREQNDETAGVLSGTASEESVEEIQTRAQEDAEFSAKVSETLHEWRKGNLSYKEHGDAVVEHAQAKLRSRSEDSETQDTLRAIQNKIEKRKAEAQSEIQMATNKTHGHLQLLSTIGQTGQSISQAAVSPEQQDASVKKAKDQAATTVLKSAQQQVAAAQDKARDAAAQSANDASQWAAAIANVTQTRA